MGFNFFIDHSLRVTLLPNQISWFGVALQDAFRRLALDVILDAGFGINNEALLPTALSAENPLLSIMDKAPW